MILKLFKKIILRSFMISGIAIGFIATMSAAKVSNPPPKNVRRMVVFGDSLSDNGNDYMLTTKLHAISSKIPVLPATEIYWNGRFSDGPVWSEYLASILHFMPQKISADNRESKQFEDFAYGGAWAETTQPDSTFTFEAGGKSHSFPPPLGSQVDNYISNNKLLSPLHYKSVLSQDLVFIWTGGNDYINQEIGKSPIMRSPSKSTDYVMAAIRKNLNKLLEAGNKNFVILGLPDLSEIPDIELRDPHHVNISPNISMASMLHNQKLKELVAEFKANHPEARFIYVDTYDLFENEFQSSKNRARLYKQQHSISEKVTSPCIIESNDPDPTHAESMHLSPLLAMTISPNSSKQGGLITENLPIRNCDLHTENDKSSPFNFAEHYHAGGMFFDHIHPVTHVHATISLNVCHKLSLSGLQFYQQSTKQFVPVDCSRYSTKSLVDNIVNPPFPTK